MRALFIDDERRPHDVSWIQLPKHDYVVLRSMAEFEEYVVENGLPNFISFDHDLGADWEGNEYPSGYDIAKSLVDKAVDGMPLPDDFAFTVHSKNPVGAENITALLGNMLKCVRSGK